MTIGEGLTLPPPSPPRPLSKLNTTSGDHSDSAPVSPVLRPSSPVLKHHAQEEHAAQSPRDSTQSTENVDGADSARRAVGAGDERHEQTANTRRDRDADADDDEFHDIALDNSVQIITKSIYTEKKGFLTRLRGGGSSSASSRSKYAPGESSSSAVSPVDAKALSQAEPTGKAVSGEATSACRDEPPQSVEIVLEEDDPIDVSIEQTTPPRPQEPDNAAVTKTGGVGSLFEIHRQTSVEEYPHDVAPQVVIHSTESDSDSGFVTLNPVISQGSRGRRSSTSAVMSTTTNGSSTPLLMNLPIVEASDSQARMVLTVNALGATGLAKVEKFGTQSTFLVLRLTEMNGDNDPSSSSSLRTVVHKKGGSEAQWNQQFTISLRSKTKQLLHASVRTHSKVLVGETNISLAHVKASLYDQHFTLYRSGNDGMESAGQIHLQLTVTDAVPVAPVMTTTPSVLVPPSRQRQIPPALRNGALMFKVPYHSHSLLGPGATKRQWISVTENSITWCDPIDTSEKSRRLELSLIIEIREGSRTKAFERLLQNEPTSVAREHERCFSVISKTRTLDLVASSKEEAQVWIQGLRSVLAPTQESSTASYDPSAQMIQDFRSTALSPRDAHSTLQPNKRQQQAHWRSVIFDYARQHEHDQVSALLHAGCPIDILETGTGDTVLMLACRLGDVRLVEICLQWRAKNDPHPEFGETALQVAVNAGHAECLVLILRTAAKSDMDSEIVNHIDSNNDAPLHVAARRGDLACMQLLLHHGADVCVVEEYGRTPLHCAVMSGNVECVAYLLDVGGDSVLNAGDHDGDTALHYAAQAGYESIVKLLLESAADVRSTNVQGESPRDLATRESHIGCVKMLAKYDHSSESERHLPATRNESASSLLQSRQNEEDEEFECDDVTDGMDDEDAESECPMLSEPSNSPVRRGPIGPGLSPRELYEEDYYQPGTARHLHNQQPISPSARVREVLATQRERASIPRSSVVPPLHFHSARELRDPRHSLMLSLDRQAYTERMDRYQPVDYGYTRSFDYEFDRRYHESELYHRRPMDPYQYPDDRGYLSSPGYGSRGRSMSALAHLSYHHDQFDEYGRWYGPRAPVSASARRSNSADMMMARGPAWQQHQSAYVEEHVPLHAAPPPPPPATEVHVWETYYSEEGYPFYVNTQTGVSQWENPYETNSSAPPTIVANGESYAASSEAVQESTSTAVASVRAELERRRQENSSKPYPEAGNSVTAMDQPTQPVQVLLSSPSPVSPPASPRSSKYQSRTGLSLAVDVSSPPRPDDSRPVFVPSPRARSPRKVKDSDGIESGFDKSSRPSSPRGKTKNVQLIELKRANNLALALASFKINDRNEQIAQAIATFDVSVVNAELLACLQRFFPTADEAQQLRTYEGPIKSLGAAERFFFRLLQVPEVDQRIDCFLFKLQFARNYRSTHSKIQIIKRACRDLVENFSFVDALDSFFDTRKTRSFQEFVTSTSIFKAKYLTKVDEKLHSFQEDLRKASEIELLDMQLQMNRIVNGMASLISFAAHPSLSQDPDRTAHDVLQRFIAETRAKVSEIETEFEALGQCEDKVLQLFGESKASCQLTPIFESVGAILETEVGVIL